MELSNKTDTLNQLTIVSLPPIESEKNHPCCGIAFVAQKDINNNTKVSLISNYHLNEKFLHDIDYKPSLSDVVDAFTKPVFCGIPFLYQLSWLAKNGPTWVCNKTGREYNFVFDTYPSLKQLNLDEATLILCNPETWQSFRFFDNPET